MSNITSNEEIIKSFKKNRSQIEQVITHINRLHVRAVRKKTKVNEFPLDNLFAKLLLPLWVSILELEFNILVYSDYDLSKKFLSSIEFNALPEIDKWVVLVDFLFRERFLSGNKKIEISRTSLGDTTFHRYETLKSLIISDLKPFIELRNRISHGQWSIAFNNLGTEKNQQLTQKAWTISKKDLMLLKIFIKNLPDLLKHLIVSLKAFEETYDTNIGKINLAKKDNDIRYLHLQKR